jgi:MOSC domain-containing protein YiiM
MVEVPEIRCVAGRGIEGDRFFDFRRNYKGQITFFANEVYQDLCAKLFVNVKTPSVFRRNVITAGVDLNGLIDCEFELQEVRFLGIAECSPCHWMNAAFAPGAESALHGRGGLRAKILSTGRLRAEALEPTRA